MIHNWNKVIWDSCALALRDYYLELEKGDKQDYSIILCETPLEFTEKGICGLTLKPVETQIPANIHSQRILITATCEKFRVIEYAEALSSILSFFIRRRMNSYRLPVSFVDGKISEHILNETCERLTQTGPPDSANMIPPDEVDKRLNACQNAIEKIIKMPERDYLAFMRAFRLYQCSRLFYKEDLTLAFFLLVTSIEAIIAQFYNRKYPLEDWPPLDEWSKFLDSLGDISHKSKNKILYRMSGKSPNLRKKFKDFILDNLPESYWSTPDSKALEEAKYHNYLQKKFFKDESRWIKSESLDEQHVKEFWWIYRDGRVRKDIIPKILDWCYDTRSSFTHTGEASKDAISESYETFKPTLVSKKGEILLEGGPSYFFLERVVHDTITNFLATSTVNS